MLKLDHPCRLVISSSEPSGRIFKGRDGRRPRQPRVACWGLRRSFSDPFGSTWSWRTPPCCRGTPKPPWTRHRGAGVYQLEWVESAMKMITVVDWMIVKVLFAYFRAGMQGSDGLLPHPVVFAPGLESVVVYDHDHQVRLEGFVDAAGNVGACAHFHGVKPHVGRRLDRCLYGVVN